MTAWPTYWRPLVVHVIHRLDYGGMEAVLVDLINAMGDEPYRHAVICLRDYTAFRDRIRSPDVAVYALGKRDGKDFSNYWRLLRLLRRLRPVLVNTYNLATIDAAPFARLVGAKVVHAEHGWQVERDSVPSKHKMLRRMMSPFIDRFVAVSEDLGDWLRSAVGLSVAKLSCIHNGVDATKFSKDDFIRQAGRRRLGVEERTFVVGTVARLDPIKAQADLIEAVARLVQDGETVRPVKLFIVGEGPERARLEALIAERGLPEHVSLMGAQDAVAELLAAFDVFALPSHNEGVSIAILEAMASGLPVVATRVGGNPEVVSDGKSGLLIEAGAVEALAAALARYRDDVELARAHGTVGRTRMQAEFSLQNMVERYLRLYDDVLSGGSAKVRRGGAA